MSVQFSSASASWEYTCLFGCRGWDYESEHEAREAFLGHDCDMTA